ncbi:MAG TPA: EAL domain-containing protein [Actinomycetes bacterium]|jgi:diguanylate cyclase (GGDEF)-like protein/PAS domain S-box-containing protein|nr:EAL domain-containing protein [Actinomycetes bacterium]
MPQSPSAEARGRGRLAPRLPILGEVRLDRRLGWVIPVFVVLVTVMVGYNARATANQRGSALVVNIAARQRALVERYTKDVLLVVDGFQADPAQSGAVLHQTADALLDGGTVTAPQGNDNLVRIPAARDWKVRRKLDQDRRLIEELTRTGDRLMRHRRGAGYAAEVTRLRVLSAQLSSVSNDAVGELTRHTEASLSRLVRIEIALGLLSALAALAMGLLLRRAGAEQAAQFRSLVHNSSDLITVVAADGTIRYQSPSAQRLLGRAAADLTGTAFGELVHPDDRDHVDAAIGRLVEAPGAIASFQCRLSHRDGSWRHAESICTNLSHDSRVGGLVLNVRDITERTALEEQLTHQAFHDPLTGLANRALFVDRVDHALARASRQGPTAAVLFLDLDDFKTVNDTLGHSAGNHLLVAVADRLLAVLRPADTAARLGGDEFAILLEDINGEEDALAIAERVTEVFHDPYPLEGHDVLVRASIGVAIAEPQHRQADDLLRNADMAMYLAKSNGKGRYERFQPSLHRSLRERFELIGDLRQALERGQLLVHYQPIVELASGRITGLEALVRWRHPTRGMVGPRSFIPLAEETGLIIPLGRWVLGQACEQGHRWQRHTGSDLSVSVNLSARQFQQPGLVDDVARALRRSGLRPSSLILEITESLLMHDTDATIDKLHQLKALGVRLAIDDFGTGYSSLSYLRRFPVDILKVDKSFVDGVTGGSEDSALARAIIKLGHTLRLQTVAEGVEGREQAGQLLTLQCDLGQGYYFAKPMDAGAVAALLDRQPPQPAAVADDATAPAS